MVVDPDHSATGGLIEWLDHSRKLDRPRSLAVRPEPPPYLNLTPSLESLAQRQLAAGGRDRANRVARQA